MGFGFSATEVPEGSGAAALLTVTTFLTSAFGLLFGGGTVGFDFGTDTGTFEVTVVTVVLLEDEPDSFVVLTFPGPTVISALATVPLSGFLDEID